MRLFANSLSSGYSETPDLNSVINVLIIAGQSNAVGYTNGVAPISPYITPNDNAYIMGSIGNTEFTTFSVMDYTTGNFVGNEFGVEASFAYSLNNKETYIIKIASGGTTLAVDWSLGSVLRTRLINYIRNAKGFLADKAINVRWSLLWDQWESDLSNTTYSDNYELNYQGFINDILNKTSISLTNHFITKVNLNSNTYITNQINGNTVLQSQINNSAIYNANVISFDDLTLWDGVHYSSESNITRGERIYALL